MKFIEEFKFLIDVALFFFFFFAEPRVDLGSPCSSYSDVSETDSSDSEERFYDLHSMATTRPPDEPEPHGGYTVLATIEEGEEDEEEGPWRPLSEGLEEQVKDEDEEEEEAGEYLQYTIEI